MRREWAEHVAPQNPRADAIESAFGKIVVNPRGAVAFAVHFLKTARWEEPLHQIDAANAERIVDVLVRAGTEPIKCHTKTMHA